ncbi:hypothetical protein Trydic_g19081 [Trypoxylus dichotomus]
MAYAAETGPDTSKIVEMKTIRSIHGKTLLDEVRSEDLPQQNKIQDVDNKTKKMLEHALAVREMAEACSPPWRCDKSSPGDPYRRIQAQPVARESRINLHLPNVIISG